MSAEAAAALRRAASPVITHDSKVLTRPMAGHSGAEIFLYTQGRTSFVRKIAGAPARNMRLVRQCEKLRLLARCGFAVPRVLRAGETDAGCAFYDMEYVPARTVATAICDGGVLFQPQLLAALERLFSFGQLTEADTLPASAFQDKIAQIAGADTGVRATYRDVIAAMARRLGALSWDDIPASQGHGDLTLENILLTAKGRVVLIDCDAGWLSSWWIDAAKLYQDTSGHWFLRDLYLEDKAGQPLLRAAQRLDRFQSVLDGLLARLDPILPQRIAQLAALHLFRTLPYARDERLVAFVLARMHAVLATPRS